MTTLLYTHPSCLEHETGAHHPERPARLNAIYAVLDGADFAALDRREPPRASEQQIGLVHPESYIAFVMESIPENGITMLDADTSVSPGSREAALRAAGAACAAVDAVFSGEAGNAFCAVRPPGHHAEPTRPMGFCVFNNVAIGAEHARKTHGLQRAAVVDFDVHHGNGTQAMFFDDPDLFYASTHQAPLYPGTGAEYERGVAGNIVNRPLPAGAGSAEFRAAMEKHILPSLRAFGPDFVFISAGFDGHADDPLAGLRLREDDYAWITEELLQLAADTCGGRLVSMLEGGYDLDALGRSVGAHVRALMAA